MGRLREKYQQKHEKLQQLVAHLGEEVLASTNFEKSRHFIQHGDVSVHKHSFAVARTSLDLCNKLEKIGIHCNRKDLVRGALLHDYFLYDWHDKNRPGFKRFHGFHHAKTALRNASGEYDLTAIEKDIIKKHMWPLNPAFPMCREAWIVTLADKKCSFVETINGFKKRKSSKA